MSDTLYITWSGFHQATARLAQRLAMRGPWSAILAVTRGGLIPAGVLAQQLGVRYVDTICAVSYQDRIQGELEFLKIPAEIPQKLLIVDDIVDSGRTAQAIRKKFPRSYCVSIYAKPNGLAFVDDFEQRLGQEVWVEFPWSQDLECGV